MLPHDADGAWTIEEFRDRVATLEAEVARARADASAARAELLVYRSSRAGRLILRYRRTVNDMLPQGTLRRRGYEKVVRTLLTPLRRLRSAGADETTALFDPEWYVAQCFDVSAIDDPLGHYRRIGGAEGISPHPCFDPDWYGSQVPEGELMNIEPLDHYVRVGARAGLSPHPCFDPSYYLGQLDPHVASAAAEDPLIHYLTTPSAWELRPSPMFDGRYYLRSNPDVRAAAVNPLHHYLRRGEVEGRRPNSWFSPDWYRVQYSADLGFTGSPFIDFVTRRSESGLARSKQEWRDAAITSLAGFMKGSQRVRVPSSQNAMVTVAIAVWNQAHFTLQCLKALEGVTVPLRVVIVDNASTDDTADLLARCDGIEVISNAENVGFLKATNQVLLSAETPYVLLLNNDCIVRPGAIEAAVRVIEETQAGAVAAKIVLPNGLLQEAGSFLWRDGSAQGYLRGREVTVGPSMHRREVDFGSGAFLLMRTGAVQALGGLDEAYLPAYYEEVDLCMRLRRAGWPTVYDPAVVVDHVEFGSSRKSDDAIRLQVEHRHLVAERFADELADRPSAGEASDHRLANWLVDDRRGVVFVDDRLPIASEGSGLPRAAALTSAAAAAPGRHVLLAPLVQEATANWAPLTDLLTRSVECYPEYGVAGLSDFLGEHRGRFDTIVVSRLHNFLRVLQVRETSPMFFEGVRLVYDSEAIGAERERLQAALAGRPLSSKEYAAKLAEEMGAARQADTVLAVSEHDLRSFQRAEIPDARLVGHALVPQSDAPGPEGRDGLLFVGRLVEMDSPNIDSIVWLMGRCYPLLGKRGETAVRLVGKVAPALRARFTAMGADVLGTVEDLQPEFDAARVFVAPTRFAAGTPIKVVTAAAAGLPVVCTSVLCQQLGWTPGVDLLVADEPETFAEAIHQLLTDDALWSRVQRSALSRVEREYSAQGFEAAVAQMLDADARV